jgi:hypothetical protein
MSNFKEKNIKYSTFCNNILNKSMIIHGTLDSKHTQIMNEFNKNSNNLNKLKAKIIKLKKEYSDCDNNFENNRKKLQLKDQFEELELEVEKIEKHEDELDYFNNTSDILFKYYDNNVQEKTVKNIPTDLLEFFNHTKYQKKNQDDNDKYNLFDKYMKITSNTNLNKNTVSQLKYCANCNIEKTLHLQEGFLICTNCGESEYILLDSDKPNYKDPIVENKPNGYKRMNHFSELLNQFQGKESTDIPNDVFEKIIHELKVLKISDLSKLDVKTMRNILKNLDLNNFYEHIPYIINKLNGIPPPTMSRELEEKIRIMFKEVQEPWIKFKGSMRKNFLNNNYVFHKIFELLEEDNFLPFFPYLKSREKLQEHDEIWKKICSNNKWEFIPSL